MHGRIWDTKQTNVNFSSYLIDWIWMEMVSSTNKVVSNRVILLKLNVYLTILLVYTKHKLKNGWMSGGPNQLTNLLFKERRPCFSWLGYFACCMPAWLFLFHFFKIWLLGFIILSVMNRWMDLLFYQGKPYLTWASYWKVTITYTYLDTSHIFMTSTLAKRYWVTHLNILNVCYP